MNSYIPSNTIEVLSENFLLSLLVNDEYQIQGVLVQIKKGYTFVFKPFSGLPVDEEKDCVNDIAVFLINKLKKINSKTYASQSYFDNDKGNWVINFECVEKAK